MYHSAAFVLFLTAALPAAAADRKFDADAKAKAIAPFIDEQTVAVLHADLDAIDLDAMLKKADKIGKFEPKDKETAKAAAAEVLDALKKAGAHDYYMVFSLADVPQSEPFSVIPVAKNGDPKAVADMLKKMYAGPGTADLNGCVVGAAAGTLERLAKLTPTARPEIAKAFAAADGGTAQMAFFATTDTRKVLEDTMPKLPPQLGGGSIQVLTRGLQWAVVRIDTDPNVDVHLTVQAADNAAAKALLGLVDKAYKFLSEEDDFKSFLKEVPGLVEKLTPKVDDSRLVLDLKEDTLVSLLKPAAIKVREAAFRMQSSNNLKQLTLAMHNFHDTYGAFPPVAHFSKDGKPLLSWRVQILPYIEEGPLYNQFHLDEPWDSAHNKALIKKMPKVFNSSQDPKLAPEGKTTYVGVVDKSTMFTGDKKGVQIKEVTDGTSNTIFIVDADDKDAVIWTKPDDLKLDPKDPKKGISNRFPSGFLAAFADGSVHSVSHSISKETLNALFTRNGGETVEVPK